MLIQIKRLSLRNFKGIKELEIEFNDGITSIKGANGTGKTTIVDAFRWLLFGKDSHNSSTFTIKTTKSDGEAIHELEHEVEAVLSIDFVNTTLRKVYKEDWRTRRGEATPYLAGHTNTYFWNGVPLAEKEYKKSVDDLIPEELFKLVTDPLYFNSEAMKWKQRREMLVKMAGGVTDTEVAAGNKDFEGLLAMLTANKTLDGLKAEIGAKKKKIKSELDFIPARIDELKRAIPEPEDWDAIKMDIVMHKANAADLDASLLDKSKLLKEWNKGKMELQRKVNQAREAKSQVKYRIEQAAKDAERERVSILDVHRRDIKDVADSIANRDNQILSAKNELASANERRAKLLEDFSRIKSEKIEFDENEFSCPTCKRELDPMDIETKRETMLLNFNKAKADNLDYINKKGREEKERIQQLEDRIEELTQQRVELDNNQREIEEVLKAALESDQDRPSLESAIELRLTASIEYQETTEAVAKAEKALADYPEPEQDTDTEKAKALKAQIAEKISELDRRLAKKDQIEATDKRIEELEKQETTMANELAELERTEFLILEFNKAKIQLVDEKINGLFKLVTFRMFKRNLTGGEEECCDTLIDGVPWSDANNAAKINAGLDIISALNNYYDVAAPIFCDNAEAVNNLRPIETQIIRLVVTTDPVLMVEGVPLTETAAA